MQLMKKWCLALSLVSVSSIISIEPSQATALDDYNTGSSYAGMGDFTLAIKYFDKAIAARMKNFPEPYVNKGLCLQRLGMHDKAILCYNEALRVQPKLAPAYQNRGTAYLKLNKYAEALQDFNTVISLPKTTASIASVSIYIDRGRAFAGLRRFKDSFADFDYVIAMPSTIVGIDRLKGAAVSEKRKAQALMSGGGGTGVSAAASTMTYSPSKSTTATSTTASPTLKPTTTSPGSKPSNTAPAFPTSPTPNSSAATPASSPSAATSTPASTSTSTTPSSNTTP